jgi:phospholipid/cholesterol/gamma-HCH transport system substrate-binding protein
MEKVTETAPPLERLATGLQPVVDRLEPLARRLPATVRAADPFLTQTRKLVRGGPRALRRIDPIIRGAEPIATDFPPVIEAAIPLAKDLTAYVPETIGFFQNFGTATGSYDRNGHLVNLGFGLAQTPPSSTTSRTLTGADCGAGALELPFTRLPGVAECKPWRDFETAFDDLDPTQKDGGG